MFEARSLLLGAAIWLLSGCSALSPFSSVTKLDLQLKASEQLNHDLNGRPSPIVLRLFELRHPVAFENADFFSLYDRARESLPQDLIATQELELRPGEDLALKLRIAPGSRYVGLLAAYRDLPHTRWRHVLTLPDTQRSEVRLVLDHTGILQASGLPDRMELRP
ncbi:type VI secretion system lipoprotein TssJ [Pseudomonas chlororaphis]|nr:type VI secretion system lipoprotein TssJ [Pseudomonas chlororaphis]